MNCKYLYFNLLILLVLPSFAMKGELARHCDKDAAELADILGALTSGDASGAAVSQHEGGRRVAEVAEMFIGRGADADYKTDSLAGLRLNVDTFTPMSFVNTALAIASASTTRMPSEAVVEQKLQDYSCRRGENIGFASLMWHSSDWVLDNIYRDNLKELTESYAGARSKIKSLDYMSRHRDEFKALANEETFDKVKMLEWGFRNHRLPMLPKSAIGKKEVAQDMRDGDILILIANNDGEDIYQIGVVKNDEDGAHLIHFDPAKGMVVKEPEPMKRYFNLVSKYFSGFRWLRAVF